MKKSFKALGLAFALVTCLGISGSPAAQWPSEKPITINCGAAGGTVDLRVRGMVPYLEKLLKQSVVVVNHGGNAMALNDTLVAAPDGYTFGTLLCPDILAYLNPSASKKSYKPSDFAIVCQFLADHVILAVRPNDERLKDVVDLKSLQKYLKDHPDDNLLCAVGREGSIHYLAWSNLNRAMGTDNFIGVPNSGGVSVRKTSFFNKDVDIYFGSIADTAPMVKDGKARPLAILSTERAKVLPELATAKEQGFELDSNHSRGLVTGPKVAPKLVEAFSNAVKTVSEDPAYIADLAKVLDQPGYLNAEDYKKMIEEESKGYIKMLQGLGLVK